jgi:hypothetical protein
VVELKKLQNLPKILLRSGESEWRKMKESDLLKIE